MRKLAFITTVLLIVFGCEKSESYVYDHSYSISPIKATPSIDYMNRVDYKLSGYNIHAYSTITVCFRRLDQYGYTRSYSEIIDTRDNPNTYQTYHTYKKLNYNETGVKVRWIELTDKNTGQIEKYINYK